MEKLVKQKNKLNRKISKLEKLVKWKKLVRLENQLNRKMVN